jgi:hypothetical protein
MTTATQQQQGKPATAWKPDRNTYFLVDSSEGADVRARKELVGVHKTAIDQRRIVRELNVSKLTSEHTVVCVFLDPEAQVEDPPGSGNMRDRRLPAREPGTQRKTPGEPPVLLQSAPIHIRDLWRDGDENDSGVRIASRRSEDGREVLGLMGRISRACTLRDDNGMTRVLAVPYHRDDIGKITLRQS